MLRMGFGNWRVFLGVPASLSSQQSYVSVPHQGIFFCTWLSTSSWCCCLLLGGNNGSSVFSWSVLSIGQVPRTCAWGEDSHCSFFFFPVRRNPQPGPMNGLGWKRALCPSPRGGRRRLSIGGGSWAHWVSCPSTEQKAFSLPLFRKPWIFVLVAGVCTALLPQSDGFDFCSSPGSKGFFLL